MIKWLKTLVQNMICELKKVIPAPFTNALSWVQKQNNLPNAIDVDEINKMFIINEKYILSHGRCSHLVFKKSHDYVIHELHKANIAGFNALIAPVMAEIIHAAATIKTCYCHKPMIYGVIAHKLIYKKNVTYKSNEDALANIDQYNLTNLIEIYPIYGKDLLNHLDSIHVNSILRPLNHYSFKAQIVLEYDETMVDSQLSFSVNLFDKGKTQNQIEHALNDSYNKYNTNVVDLNGVLINIITPTPLVGARAP